MNQEQEYTDRDAEIRQAVGALEFLGVPVEVLIPLYEWMSKNVKDD